MVTKRNLVFRRYRYFRSGYPVPDPEYCDVRYWGDYAQSACYEDSGFLTVAITIASQLQDAFQIECAMSNRAAAIANGTGQSTYRTSNGEAATPVDQGIGTILPRYCSGPHLEVSGRHPRGASCSWWWVLRGGTACAARKWVPSSSITTIVRHDNT